MAPTSRAEQVMWAQKLQRALGDGYRIDFDACESCMTYCYHDNQLYKVVPNEEMRGSLNVVDYCVGYGR